MPLQATSGAASYDAFGGGVLAVPNFIEDVFSTYLYTGNNSTLSINNGIDVSGKGGLVWIKNRQQSYYHTLVDTVRGANNQIYSNATDAQYNATGFDVTAFTSTGFTLGPDIFCNQNNGQNVSWTFREQPKFFDVLTYTGTGSNTTIAHNLGSIPGSIIIKRTDTTAAWAVYHRSLANTEYLVLNTTAAAATGATWWNSTTPTSTVFSVGTDASVNASGGTYVAYVFAHDAGGFGLTSTDNVISCGAYTGNGSTTGPVVTLGYEPQWIMLKNASAVTDWVILDTMRGLVVGGPDRELNPNQAAIETSATYITPTATGFQLNTTNGAYNASGNTFIYIAIRRGLMKVPTDATKVFEPVAITGNSTSRVVTNSANFPIDAVLIGVRNGADDKILAPRLTGEPHLRTNVTSIETSNDFPANPYPYMNGLLVDGSGGTNQTGKTYIYEMLRRAPSFFDVVCYSGDNNNPRTINHNLGAIPELMIVKRRNAVEDWSVYCAYMSTPESSVLFLNLTDAQNSGTGRWNNTSPTSTVFSLAGLNSTGGDYVNYLFSSCPNVSKVGSYTGNGTTQTINCGFAGGVRFVLIKRTDATGSWYVYDTARGMTVLTDPYLLLNTTAAESATLGSVTTVSTGFALDSTILAAINVSAASYIFLAIA